jgi:ABC-type transporter MlaC component
MRELSVSLCIAGAYIVLAAQPHAEPPPQTEFANAEQVGAFVEKLESGTRTIFVNAKNGLTPVHDGCREFLNEILDLDAMAHAVNAEIWEKMTSAQRGTFRVAFERRMIGNCVRQFDEYEGAVLQLAGVRTTESGHLLATVRVGAPDDGKLIVWRLTGLPSDRLRAVDVITDGRSAVADASFEFAAVYQSVNGDIEALIAFLQR